MERELGILLPVFSLEGEYGIGDFGKSAYRFVDFLRNCGVKVWQVLPLCPIGAGNSPYSSPCSDAVNPYFIDLNGLTERGLLSDAELNKYKIKSDITDYDNLPHIEVLKKAFRNYKRKSKQTDYAIYMALKEFFGGEPWYNWGIYAEYDSDAVKNFMREHKTEIAFWQFVYDLAIEDWIALKSYANDNGIKIMGDMPFYVSHDSVEVWMHKSLFALDGYMPSLVAGVPPDYFSKTGQRWGNPCYVWHNKEILPWWKQRIAKALKFYDILRLDHFRGFDEYYAIPFSSPDATVGQWQSCPGKALFEDIKDLPIVAEDLGIITDSVRELLSFTGYPGMRVLQFGFDEGSTHAPSVVPHNSVCYTGTHDNPPLKIFLSESDNLIYDKLLSECEKLAVDPPALDIDEMIDCIIELGNASKAKLFVVPMFDLIHSDKRINTPGTVGNFNWSARIGDYRGAIDKVKSLVQRRSTTII